MEKLALCFQKFYLLPLVEIYLWRNFFFKKYGTSIRDSQFKFSLQCKSSATSESLFRSSIVISWKNGTTYILKVIQNFLHRHCLSEWKPFLCINYTKFAAFWTFNRNSVWTVGVNGIPSLRLARFSKIEGRTFLMNLILGHFIMTLWYSLMVWVSQSK